MTRPSDPLTLAAYRALWPIRIGLRLPRTTALAVVRRLLEAGLIAVDLPANADLAERIRHCLDLPEHAKLTPAGQGALFSSRKQPYVAKIHAETERRRFLVPTHGEGESVVTKQVEAEWREGGLVVHEVVRGGEFAITHEASGGQIRRRGQLRDAIRLAKAMLATGCDWTRDHQSPGVTDEFRAALAIAEGR